MKKLFVLFLGIIISTAAFSQYDTTPPYLKTKLLPAFKLVSLDSSAVFDKSVLKEGQPTVVMLFNPTCEHCQHQIQLMLTMPEFTQSVNLILSSTETLDKIKTFCDKYHLERYPMIHVGKDHKYFLGGFYQPKTIPVLAFYNAQNQLLYFNQGSLKKDQLLNALKSKPVE